MKITSDELCAAIQQMFPKEFEIVYRRLENAALQQKLAEFAPEVDDAE